MDAPRLCCSYVTSRPHKNNYSSTGCGKWMNDTTKEEGKGTGIGLFIVRSILEKHGGKISVISELDKGSCFDVWLPLDQA